MKIGTILGLLGVTAALGGIGYVIVKSRGPKIESQLSSCSQYIAGLGVCDDPGTFSETGLSIPAVWGYDTEKKQWGAYSKCLDIKTFTELETGRGYWLWASEACTLKYKSHDGKTITNDLYPGLNLIGWLG